MTCLEAIQWNYFSTNHTPDNLGVLVLRQQPEQVAGEHLVTVEGPVVGPDLRHREAAVMAAVRGTQGVVPGDFMDAGAWRTE